MRISLRAAAVLVAALLMPVAHANTLALATTPPIPTYSPPECAVEARWTGYKSWLGQYLIEIRLPDECPRNAGRLARIITRQGGILPPVGFFRLGGGYPRRVTYWVLSPAYVRDREAPNVWVNVPIQGAPWVR